MKAEQEISIGTGEMLNSAPNHQADPSAFTYEHNHRDLTLPIRRAAAGRACPATIPDRESIRVGLVHPNSCTAAAMPSGGHGSIDLVMKPGSIPFSIACREKSVNLRLILRRKTRWLTAGAVKAHAENLDWNR